MKINEIITWKDFEKVDLRVGTILNVEDFPEARNPAYIITVDFGPLGIKKTSAQVTVLYSKEELVGTQVMGVVNFPEKQIGPLMSQFLLTGVYLENGNVAIIRPTHVAPNGAKLG